MVKKIVIIDPQPAAAIELGYGSRRLGLDCLENGLTVFAETMPAGVVANLRGLISEISQLSREIESAKLSRHRESESVADIDQKIIKLPALRQALDRWFLSSDGCHVWYRLGAALGECAQSKSPEAWQEFTKVVKQLDKRELAAVTPCHFWLKIWSPHKTLETILEHVLNEWPPRYEFMGPVDVLFDVIIKHAASLPAARKVSRKNDARDAWMTERFTQTKLFLTCPEIRKLAGGQHPEWKIPKSDPGMRRAIKAYAARHGIELPPRRSGRPKKGKRD